MNARALLARWMRTPVLSLALAVAAPVGLARAQDAPPAEQEPGPAAESGAEPTPAPDAEGTLEASDGEAPPPTPPPPQLPPVEVTLAERMGNVNVSTLKLELASLSPVQMRRDSSSLQRTLRMKFRTVPFEHDISGVKFQYTPGKGVNGGGLGTLSLTLQAYDAQGQPLSSAHLYEFSRASNGTEINDFLHGKSGYSFDGVSRYIVLRGLVDDADAEVSRLIDLMVFDDRGYGHVSLPEIEPPPAPGEEGAPEFIGVQGGAVPEAPPE